MEQILTVLEQYNVYILIGLSIFSLLVFVMLCVTLSKFKKIQRKYEAFMTKDDLDLEQMLLSYVKSVSKVKVGQGQLEEKIDELSKQISFCTQKVGVVRYNAYEKNGADLSFAIAFLNEEDTGVVVNGIYSRDGSYTYAKPIEKGLSKHNLSEEELEAIQRAKNNTYKKL